MKIGIFSTHALWPTHFETELEIIQTLLDEKNKVVKFYCHSNLKHCDIIYDIANTDSKIYKNISEKTCLQCLKRQKKGESLLSGSIKSYPLIQDYSDIEIPDNEFLESAKNLKKLYIDNYDVGWSILSSLISATVDPFLDTTKYKTEITNLYKDCYNVYYSTIRHIKKHKLERIYVFNGRFSYTKAIFRAAQKCGVECYIHERGSTINKYGIFKNHLPHDYLAFKKKVDEYWNENSDEKEKMQVAENYFIGRRKGRMGSWKSYIEDQKKGNLPEFFNSSKKIISLFTSSEDEFASIDDSYDNPYFHSQLEGIKFVSGLMSAYEFEDYVLCIRIHPNSIRLHKSYLDDIRNLANHKNIFVLEPDSSFDTYGMLESTDVVLTFGSTVGLEGIFLDKYVIEIGKSIYCQFIGPSRPENIDEIKNLILHPSVKINKTDTYKLGYYMATYGHEYKFYQARDYMYGKYRGIDLNVPESYHTFKQRAIDKLKSIYYKITN